MAKKIISAMLLLPALAIGAPASANVGVASVVTGEPVGKPTAEGERILHIGNDMTANEVVTTQADDRVHIVFLDGSSLTVGPHSQVTIDRFVYDPARKTGEQAFSAGRGVFRYVGGAISKTSEVTVRTQSATMGIRGGIALFSVSSTGATTATLLFGASLSVTSNGVTVTTTQPGTQVATLANAAPSAPTVVMPGGLRQFDRAFQGAPQPAAAAAIGAAIGGSTIGRANSGLSPSQARAAIPGTQQAQLTNTRGEPGGRTASNQSPLVGAGPVQATGPLQGAEPSASEGSDEGAQQTAVAMQGAGPLDASSPFQASGPLQNSGPLASARPTQETGPIRGAMALSGPNRGFAPDMPNAPVRLGAALARGDEGALRQLENLLGGERGRDRETLSQLVSGLTNPGNSDDAPGRERGEGRGRPPFVPPVLPPPIYNPGGQGNVSPN